MTNNQWISETWHHCEQTYNSAPKLYLHMQKYGVNVNLLLLAEQLDAQSKWLSSPQWQQLAQATHKWEGQFLQPYRRLRQLAKTNLQQSEYQQMLDVELRLERKSQQFIASTLTTLVLGPRPHDCDSTNVDSLLDQLECANDALFYWHSNGNNLARQAFG